MNSKLSGLNLKLNIAPISIPSNSKPAANTNTKANNNLHIHQIQQKQSSSPISPISPIQEEEESKPENLVILDWDDTLHPTTYLRNGQNEPNCLELQSFGKSLYELLDLFIKTYGEENIYIITNASKEWVFKSLKDLSIKYQSLAYHNGDMQKLDYFAAIYNSFFTLNVGIISAFDLFNKQYPNQPLLWKINAFKEIARDHFYTSFGCKNGQKYNILSIGDSDDEFTASLEAKCMIKRQIDNYENNILLHRIKLTDDPTINDMINQMKYLYNYLNIIYAANQPITMRFSYF